MPGPTTLLLFALATFLLTVTPGPGVLYVTARSLSQGRRAGFASMFGIESGEVVWLAAAATGVAAVLSASTQALDVLRFAGAAYLIYLGVSLWLTDGTAPRAEPSGFVKGLLTNLTNPKSVVYFGSIFALFIAPGTPVWVTVAAVGIVLFNTVVWYGTVAAVFSHDVVQKRFIALQRPINRVAGTVMIAFGARLILVRR